MRLAKGAPDLMQRLPGPPTAPDLGSLGQRKSRSLSFAHKLELSPAVKFPKKRCYKLFTNIWE
jgi:hypothetical protein